MPDQNQATAPAATGAPARNGLSTCLFPTWSWAVWLSALAWGVMFTAIPPAAQNFPLGDDWAFAHGAIWFAHGAGIHYSKWASMPQLGQWLWSWPFLQVTDLAHVALRASVIVLSWLGVVAFYDLLRQEGMAARLAAFGAGVLALDPLFFISSGTYMTDVPALSFALLSLNFYRRAMGGNNVRWLLAALVFALFAVMTRQTMLAVPAAAGFLLLQYRELRWRPAWLLSVLLPVAVCGGTAWWFAKRPDVLPMQPTFGVVELMFRTFVALHWCGLVVLPLGFLISIARGWKIFLCGFVFMMLVAVYLCFFVQGMPYGGLFPYCTGMISLRGTFTEGLIPGDRVVLLGLWLRIGFTILGCWGAAKILAACWQICRSGKIPGLLLVFTALQFLIMLTTPMMMDRYLEVLFPGAIFLVALRAAPSVAGWSAGLAGLLVSAVLSVALLHDWFSWNSARWELGREAIATKIIRPADIEGGFEWNGWFGSADPAHPLEMRDPRQPDQGEGMLALPFTRRFFPQVSGHFALSFTQPENTAIVASLPYSVWLPPAKKEFLLVKPKP